MSRRSARKKESVSPLQSIKRSRRTGGASITRNYVGDERVLRSLRSSDFDEQNQHDGRELRSEVRVDYNESHLSDNAFHRRHRQQTSRSRSPTKRRIEIPLDDGIHSMEFTNTPAPAPQHSHDEFDHLVIIIVAFVACLALAVKAKAWLATV
jgi:hypothetical protein